MAHSIIQRLAQCAHECVRALVHFGFAGDHDIDGYAVRHLDLVRHRADRRLQRGLGVDIPAIEIRAQLALLDARERRHAARIGGLTLDQRQGLQHRIVQVRRDIGPLVGPGFRALRGSVIAPQAHDERRQQQDETEEHDHGRDRDI